MTPVECEFESEVLTFTLQGRWPQGADAHLRAHVEECGICSDAAAIAGVIEQAREETRVRAVIPDSGHVWWHAQLRARREAAETANCPMTAAQVIAFVCAVGLLGACIRAASTWFQWTLGRIAANITVMETNTWFDSVTRLMAEHAALGLAMAAVVFLIPAAAYLALGRD